MNDKFESNRTNNEFEKELKELEEWQNNQFNPGYYVGNGRIPSPIKGLSKKPIILIVFGFVMLLPIVIVVLAEFNWSNLLAFTIPSIIALSLIYGGIRRIFEKK